MRYEFSVGRTTVAGGMAVVLPLSGATVAWTGSIRGDMARAWKRRANSARNQARIYGRCVDMPGWFLDLSAKILAGAAKRRLRQLRGDNDEERAKGVVTCCVGGGELEECGEEVLAWQEGGGVLDVVGLCLSLYAASCCSSPYSLNTSISIN